MRQMRDRVIERANTQASGASAAVFRILFGLAATIGALRFLDKGWVERLYVEPAHHLTYPWFGWVHPLPDPFMQLHLFVLAALGVCIALGYRYRIAIGAYAIGFTYVELIDASLYLNHYWWVTLASFLLIFLPLHNMWSLDSRAGRTKTLTVPTWTVWAVRGQLAVVYIFAGIAKLQFDWLVNALPMKFWLADSIDFPVIGQFLAEPSVAYVASWAGAFFDCTIVGWLLWSKSRPFAYVAVIGFHVVTGMLFQIGMFPMLMIGGTLIFFSPNWPLKFWSRLRKTELPATGPASPAPVKPVNLKFKRPVVLLCALAVFEVAIPLRHLAYPGDVRWTDEGYYGSWRVMLTEKVGTTEFHVKDPRTNEQWTVDPRTVLTDWQARQAAVRPDLLLDTAHIISDQYQKNGHSNVEVRADAFVSFNGRPNQRLVDPSVDLAKVNKGPGHKSFVLPLKPAVYS